MGSKWWSNMYCFLSHYKSISFPHQKVWEMQKGTKINLKKDQPKLYHAGMCFPKRYYPGRKCTSQIYLYFCFQILDLRFLEECFSVFDYLFLFLIKKDLSPLMLGTLNEIVWLMTYKPSWHWICLYQQHTLSWRSSTKQMYRGVYKHIPVYPLQTVRDWEHSATP